MNLAEFLARAARTPFAWGRFDCGLWQADWLVALGRPDPAYDLRGRYRTALGCARVLGRHGGMKGVVGLCAARAGLSETDAPLCGDVGVVEVITAKGKRLAGAICTGRRWAMLGESGLVVAEVQPVKAWRI